MERGRNFKDMFDRYAKIRRQHMQGPLIAKPAALFP